MVGGRRQATLRELIGTNRLSRLFRVLLRNPPEGLDYVIGRIDSLRDRLSAEKDVSYVTESDWRRRLHDELGVRLPCDAEEKFSALRNELAATLPPSKDSRGVQHDGDVVLAEIAWCLCSHLRPQKVVETGVARGITSRFILEALESNSAGRLWSIDLPPLRDPWWSQVGAAVPPAVRGRWTYRRGSTRRLLNPLLGQLNSIDVFIHDSLHTRRNMLFELREAWKVLSPGGAVLVDDVNMNGAFRLFIRRIRCKSWFVAREEGKPALVGLAFKE
jgi:predicted O-methyltransferase YrrM